jgi:transcriptional regulator GlxA family with amidase domain
LAAPALPSTHRRAHRPRHRGPRRARPGALGHRGRPSPLDILVVPGGLTGGAERDERLVAWLADTAATAALTASVCTGAFLLASAGVLEGREATSHWEDVDELERRFPAVTVRRQVRWVDPGAVVTSAGISAGIDMSLHLVRRQQGEELARATAHQMEYEWWSDP